MPTYRKEPIKVEAIQYTGDNREEIEEFAEGAFTQNIYAIGVRTPNGFVKMTVGDYIIRGLKGEFYPCKEHIFIETYTEVPDHANIQSTV